MMYLPFVFKRGSEREKDIRIKEKTTMTDIVKHILINV